MKSCVARHAGEYITCVEQNGMSRKQTLHSVTGRNTGHRTTVYCKTMEFREGTVAMADTDNAIGTADGKSGVPNGRDI